MYCKKIKTFNLTFFTMKTNLSNAVRVGFALFLLLTTTLAWSNKEPRKNAEKNSSISNKPPLVDDFPGWSRKQAITINAAMVDGTASLSNYPFLVTLDYLNTEVMDNGSNSARNGGGDLRFSSDAAGNNRLAIEVVEFVTSSTAANRRCQVWVKIPSLSATTNTTIYLWYGNATAQQPLPNEAFGSQEVWADYEAVWHMENDPSTSGPQIPDVTGNGHDLTSSGSMTSTDVVNGVIGNAISFDGSDDRFALASNAIINNGSFTITSWANYSGSNGYNGILANTNPWSGLWINNQAGGRAVFYESAQLFSTGGTVPANTNIKVDFVATNGDFQHFFDGAGSTSGTQGVTFANFGFIGSEEATGNGGMFQGWIDEVRLTPLSRSAGWLKTEHNNQTNPAAFAIKGVSEDATSGNDCSATGLIMEYEINDIWLSGNPTITLDEGDYLTISGLPNTLTLTVTDPAGTVHGDNYEPAGTNTPITTAHAGTYTITESSGCSVTLTVVVNSVGSNSGQNLLDTSTWTVGNGSVTGFSKNGTDAENVRELGTDPFGEQTVLWKAVPDANSDADGGWNSEMVNINPNETYRLSVWIKKTGNTDGYTYFGLYSNNSSNTHTTLLLDGTDRSNAYFWNGDLPELDKWYLLVGHMHGSGYTGPRHEDSGIYDGETGAKVMDINHDFKFRSDANRIRHRAYLYYNTDTTNRQYFWEPTIYELNDQEPSISELLNPVTNPGPGGGDTNWASGNNGIQYTGNVGIGTAAQAGYRLAVDGTIHTREVRVDNDNWADYVFQDEYELPTLEQVQQHIAEHGHLINVPSAEEVAAHGVELGEMNKVLLEKIEELTLYLLEQHRLQAELELELTLLENRQD